MTTHGPDISPDATYASASDDVVLLDVREDDEWAAGHAPGAVHVALGDLDPTAFLGGKPVIAICRSGNRSGKATATLADAGVPVRNMAGGMKGGAMSGSKPPAQSGGGMPPAKSGGGSGGGMGGDM